MSRGGEGEGDLRRRIEGGIVGVGVDVGYEIMKRGDGGRYCNLCK